MPDCALRTIEGHCRSERHHITGGSECIRLRIRSERPCGWRRTKSASSTETAAFTFAELYDRCARLAGALTGLGLNRGDRVAILAGNSHRYIETYVAAPAGGFVVVPLNTRHAEPELVYALEDSQSRVLITDREPGALAAALSSTW